MNQAFKVAGVTVFLLASARVFSAEVTIPCPEHKVGEVFKFKSDTSRGEENSSLEIKAVNADGSMEVASGSGNTRILDRTFNTIKSPDGRVYSAKQQDGSVLPSKNYYMPECPFKLGSTAEYRDVTYKGRSGAQIRGAFTMKVAPEMTVIEVPAGKINVVRVDTDFLFEWTNMMNSGNGRDHFVAYYSPEKGIPVRLESRENNGNYFTRDLLEHTPAK